MIKLIDSVITLETETTTTKTDQEAILNHLIEKILNFQTRKIKTLEAVHQRTKNKRIKKNLQMKQIRTLQVLPIQKLQNYS